MKCKRESPAPRLGLLAERAHHERRLIHHFGALVPRLLVAALLTAAVVQSIWKIPGMTIAIAALVAMGIALWYTGKPFEALFLHSCPSCHRILNLHWPWNCPSCHAVNQGFLLNTYFQRCSFCGTAPEAFQCPGCETILPLAERKTGLYATLYKATESPEEQQARLADERRYHQEYVERRERDVGRIEADRAYEAVAGKSYIRALNESWEEEKFRLAQSVDRYTFLQHFGREKEKEIEQLRKQGIFNDEEVAHFTSELTDFLRTKQNFL